MDEENKGSGNEPGRLARREREKQRHSGEILAAASEVFAKHGYDKTSMQMIAEQAELSVGKLYMHFEGKEAIYREIVRQHMENVIDDCDAVMKPGMTPLQILRERMKAAMDHFQEHFEFIRFYFDLNPGGRDEEGRRADEMFVETIRELLEKAVDAGEIRGDIDPRFLAIMMEGAAHRLVEWHVQRDLRDLGDVAGLIDCIFLKPLEVGAKAGSGKEENR